jgi:hypothetical protein
VRADEARASARALAAVGLDSWIEGSSSDEGAGGSRRREEAWEGWLAKLAAYKVVHGHCNVPVRWAEDLRLGGWVREQRKGKMLLDRGEPSSKGMTAARVAKLEAAGFEWRRMKVTVAAEPEEIEVVEETYEGATYLVCPRTKRIYENGDAGADRGGRARPRPVEGRGEGGGGEESPR